MITRYAFRVLCSVFEEFERFERFEEFERFDVPRSAFEEEKRRCTDKIVS